MGTFRFELRPLTDIILGALHSGKVRLRVDLCGWESRERANVEIGRERSYAENSRENIWGLASNLFSSGRYES
jgi:hypothetical protein